MNEGEIIIFDPFGELLKIAEEIEKNGGSEDAELHTHQNQKRKLSAVLH